MRGIAVNSLTDENITESDADKGILVVRLEDWANVIEEVLVSGIDEDN